MKLILGGVFISAVFIGAFSGPPAVHDSGSMADLNYGSRNIGLVILLTATAMFLVVVVQVLRKDPKFGRYAIGCMASGSAFFSFCGFISVCVCGHSHFCQLNVPWHRNRWCTRVAMRLGGCL